jgi:RNA polymerase sigma factor (sigma-70 family)
MLVSVTDPAPSTGPAVALSLEDWYRQHHLDLVRLGTLACGEQAMAEDAVQEVFAAMHRKPPALRNQGNPLPYLRVAVLNRCRSGIRRRQSGERARLRLVAETETVVEAAERSAVSTTTRDEVLHAVRRLPARQRDVMLLRYWLQLSEAEIAETLGISPGTVKSSASRARKALAPVLEAHR